MNLSPIVIKALKILLIYAASCIAMPPAYALEPALWEKLKTGEAVVLLRHAIAPGNGDPANFALGECDTQRNLSSEGLLQAQRIGALLKSNGIAEAAVFSSQWCRCVDTANALDLGETQTLPLLNSFYQNRATEDEQTDALSKWLVERMNNAEEAAKLPAVLVSHQVNITSLTGVYPASGELVLVGYRDAKLVVLGSVKTD